MGLPEWPVIEGKKRPHYIRLAESPVMFLGGLWESCHGDTGGELLTFSIVTKDADARIAPVHDVMPLILGSDTFDKWMRGIASRAMDIALSVPAPCVAFHEVGAAVGKCAIKVPS